MPHDHSIYLADGFVVLFLNLIYMGLHIIDLVLGLSVLRHIHTSLAVNHSFSLWPEVPLQKCPPIGIWEVPRMLLQQTVLN